MGVMMFGTEFATVKYFVKPSDLMAMDFSDGLVKREPVPVK